VNLELIDDNRAKLPPVFVKRSVELGFIEWCLDLNGLGVSEPTCSGPIGRWLVSKQVRDLFVESAELWASQDTPTLVEPVAGMRLLPFPIEYRGRRMGFSVLIAFTDEILGSDIVLKSSNQDQLEISILLHAIKGHFVDWGGAGEQFYRTLAWMYNDLGMRQSSDRMVGGYTEQLTLAYETITTLHMLGREMGSIDDPCSNIGQTLEMIGVTIGYRWTSFLVDLNDAVISLPQNFYQDGEVSFDEELIREEVNKFERSQPIAVSDGSAVYAADETLIDLDPQILVHPVQAHGRRYGWLVVGGKQGEDSYVSSHDTKTLDSIAGIFSSFIENSRLFEEQRLAFIGTVRALSGAIDAKDRYTRGHSDRVAMLSQQLALAAGYSTEQAERVRLCGILHDVGKIGVPEAVLCKNGRLTDEEFDLIKLHPEIGADLLKDLTSLEDILPGVLHHHERWDGNGYPAKLAGEDIPELGRILALADTFDAMSSNRAYRSAMPREKVLGEIEKCSGTQFEPRLAELFLELDFTAYDEAVKDHAAQDVRNAA